LARDERGESSVPAILMTMGGGGHLYQVQCLAQQLRDKSRLEFVTSEDSLSLAKSDDTIYVVPSLGGFGRSRVGQVASGMRAVVGCIRIVRETRPDVVIGLGTSLSVPLLLAAKLCGVRGMFIESITRVDSPSMTLKVIKRLRLADRCYVQWPELASSSGAVFRGNVL